MTKAQLNQVFKRHGLETVNPLNEKFNPNLHEALFQQVRNIYMSPLFHMANKPFISGSTKRRPEHGRCSKQDWIQTTRALYTAGTRRRLEGINRTRICFRIMYKCTTKRGFQCNGKLRLSVF